MTRKRSEGDHALIRAVRVLNSARSTTLDLLAGESKWLRSTTAQFYEEIADRRMLAHAQSRDVARHAIAMGALVEKLKEQNSAMERLHGLAEELGVWNQWPSDIMPTLVFVEPREQARKRRRVAL